MITSAFTCTGPHAVLIMLGIKRVENRSAMPEPAKGRCAVGCSKSFSKEEFGHFVQWAAHALSEDDFLRIPAWSDVADWSGKIVGACDYAATTSAPSRQWDEGYSCWWNLSGVACFDAPIPCRGNVGMWQMPPVLAAQVTTADVLARSVGERIATADDARRIFSLATRIAGKSEGLFVLPLDEECRVLAAPVLVSLGTETTTAVQPEIVFSEALKAGAASIVIAHNHPSGNVAPSIQDRAFTEAISRLGDSLNIKVLDHLVIS